MPSRLHPFVAALAVLLALPGSGLAQDPGDVRNRPAARFQVELGIDSLERKSYRPTFDLSWPLTLDGGTRAFFGLDYWQRINGDLEGAIDYWLEAGAEHRVSDAVSVEFGLAHLCRHLTSVFNPSVLNLNEVVGRVWVREGGARVGLGAGGYIGTGDAYDSLMVLSLGLPRFLAPELSFEAEVKWVNFDEVLHEAGLSLALGPGTDLFLRSVRTYRLGSTTILGLRFKPEGVNARYVDGFDLAAGVYPFYDTHKLLVLGSFRLAFVDRPGTRLFLDTAFATPVLSGSDFLDTFWPDRMLYVVSGEYEKRLGGLFASWYARYAVDMPADKAAPFRASLATGLAVRNQPDFDRLDRAARFEARAGIDFKFDYDLGLRLGLNTTSSGPVNGGAEFRYEGNAERSAVEVLAFLSVGKDLSVRPFLGLRKFASFAGNPAGPDPFRRKLTAGLSFFKWF
jgi:hypothetical protein